MTTARSRRLMSALALTSALALGACGTGFEAQTNAQYQAATGANLREGDVHAYNALLVDNGDDTFTLSAGLLNQTSDDQQLQEYSIAPLKGGGAVTGEPSAPVDLKPGRLATVGFDGEVVVQSEELSAGHYAKVELTFSTGPLQIEVPIVQRTAEYDDIASKPAQPDTKGSTAEKDAETAEQ